MSIWALCRGVVFVFHPPCVQIWGEVLRKSWEFPVVYTRPHIKLSIACDDPWNSELVMALFGFPSCLPLFLSPCVCFSLVQRWERFREISIFEMNVFDCCLVISLLFGKALLCQNLLCCVMPLFDNVAPISTPPTPPYCSPSQTLNKRSVWDRSLSGYINPSEVSGGNVFTSPTKLDPDPSQPNPCSLSYVPTDH